MSFRASSSVVLRQVLDRAQIATVGGLLGVTVASYLDVADQPRDPAEPDLFTSLTSTHRAAMQAARSLSWCIERFGAEREVLEAAAVAYRAARRLDGAYLALSLARRRTARWRALVRRDTRAGAECRAERARAYAHAAMVYSEHVERLRAVLAA
jgi:hypothetical protein